MEETQALQVDIFGETHSLEVEPTEKPRDASAAPVQPRLFEPQFEGQLTFE